MLPTKEHFFECPYCGTMISMVLDMSVAVQGYIEDCERCCNPIDLVLEVEDGDLVRFEASSIEQ